MGRPNLLLTAPRSALRCGTQGVNSALEDVIVLERALATCGDRVEDALPEYERTRAADAKALVRVGVVVVVVAVACWRFCHPNRSAAVGALFVAVLCHRKRSAAVRADKSALKP